MTGREQPVDLNKRLIGWILLGVAIAAFVGALVTFLIWESGGVLVGAIVLEALALIGLVLLFFWPEPEFEAGNVNPELVRCPRCSSVFDPPKRGEEFRCPTCGLQGRTPDRSPKEIKPTS